jgi:hypothetical protein
MGALLLAALLPAAPALVAQAPYEPHYLQALSELRSARDYIQYDKGAPGGDLRHHAVDEINKAIDEIKHAAWDKNTMFAPPAQGGPAWAPIHMARHYMELARRDVTQGSDSQHNNELRNRIILHEDEAMHALDHLMQMQIP